MSVLTCNSYALQSVSLPVFEVSKSNMNVFSTPVAYYDGEVYVVNVEPATGPNNGINLRTVVRKGKQVAKNQWAWETYVLDGATLDDPYHTQPSIAVDKAGYVHVAFNMHNMPWQYAVSTRPKDISSFVFRGEEVSSKERYAVQILNKTSFPSIGRAAIPGNQITYPAFFYDRNKDLFVTYRFATRPKRLFDERGFAGGIARYDVTTKLWVAIGGNLAVSSDDADLPKGVKSASVKAFAYTDKWSVYLIRLAFDRSNHMHATWTWRENGAGRDTSNPTYAFSPDGGRKFLRSDGTMYSLPIDVKSADVMMGKEYINKFDASTSVIADPSGKPFAVVQHVSGRFLVNHDGDNWSSPEIMPFGADVLLIDDDGTQWAFASEPMVLRRDKGDSAWTAVYRDRDREQFFYAKVFPVTYENMFIIYALNRDFTKVKIIMLKTK